MRPKVSVGGELSVTAGPVGAGAVVSELFFFLVIWVRERRSNVLFVTKLDTGIELSPVLSYIKSRGLYGGVQVDGTHSPPIHLQSHYL